MDYYQILGLDRSATPEDIKLAYRRLAKKYHPDRNVGSRHAEEKFKEITEAYKVLSDTSKKAVYEFSEANQNHPWVNSFTYQERDRGAGNNKKTKSTFNYHLHNKPTASNRKKNRIIFTTSILVILLILATVTLTLLRYSSNYYYNTGLQNYKEKEYAAALQNVNQSFSFLGTERTEAYLLAGKILTNHYKDYNAALEYINKGLGIEGKNLIKAELYYLKGKCLKAQKQFKSAYTNYKLAAVMDLNLDSLYHDLASLNCFVFKNYDDAIKYYNTLISINPSFAEGYIGRAFSYQKLGDHQKAVTDLKALIALDRQNATAFFMKGISEQALNHPSLACEDLKQAVILGSEKAFELYKKTCN